MKIKELFQKFFSSKTVVIITAIIVTIAAGAAVTGIIIFGDNKKSTSEETTTKSAVSQNDEWVTEETTEAPAVVIDYKIMINRALNCLTVYMKDSTGEFIPYKAMVCSTGLGGIDSTTPPGEFSITGKAAWCQMVDDSYTQYACRINGPIMIHSISYAEMKRDTLYYKKFNLLGTRASLGCIRLCAADIKWIYDNCYVGTPVIVYDDFSSPGPLGKPTLPKIALDHPLRGWDPTDTDSNNPWRTYTTYLNGDTRTFTVSNGSSSSEILTFFNAGDSLGNNLNHKLAFEGTYSMYQEGTYNVNVVIDGWYPGQSIPITIIVLAAPPVVTYSINPIGTDVINVVKDSLSSVVLSNFTAIDSNSTDLTSKLELEDPSVLSTVGSYSANINLVVGGSVVCTHPITINVTES